MARYPRGSTPKLTPALIARLAAALEAGWYMETAAVMVGLSKDTVYRWLRRAEHERDGVLAELSYAVERAKAIAEVRAVAVVKAAGEAGDWRALAWLLERRSPERYARGRTG